MLQLFASSTSDPEMDFYICTEEELENIRNGTHEKFFPIKENFKEFMYNAWDTWSSQWYCLD